MGRKQDIPCTRRVIMSRRVASQWLAKQASAEHRLTVYYHSPQHPRRIPAMLRLFRDKKTKIGSVSPLPDLGIREEFDHLIIWTSNRVALVELKDWFEARNYETSGVW